MKQWSKNTMLAVAAAVALSFGTADKAAADLLTIGMSADITSMDPHFYNATPNKQISFHVFETLTFLGATGAVEPRLATGWTLISDTEWELKLREGIKWHDGTDFTSADVLYSLGRLDSVPGAVGGFDSLISAVTDVSAVDEYTIRITTGTPSPNLPISLTMIAMVPAANEGMPPEDYNSGKAMIGTGPYKFISYSPGEGVQLIENPDWWGGAVPWSDLSFKIISNVAVRSTALLSGDVDVVEMPAAADLERLKNNPDLHVLTAPALRVAFINPIQLIATDGIHVTGSDGEVIDPSPLTEFKVRKALSIAINREGLASRIMQGTGSATGQMIPEGIYSHITGYPVPVYDVEAAKVLMKEAGFADGFTLTLTAANDRVPYNIEVAQAIAQMWSRIGVKTSVNGVPTSVYTREAGGQMIPAYLGSWGNSSMEVGTTLTNLLRTADLDSSVGVYNWSKYSNPVFDAVLDKAVSTMDADAREAMLEEATAIALDDYAVFPLYHFTNLWAMKANLTYPTRSDAMTFAWLITSTGE